MRSCCLMVGGGETAWFLMTGVAPDCFLIGGLLLFL